MFLYFIFVYFLLFDLAFFFISSLGTHAEYKLSSSSPSSSSSSSSCQCCESRLHFVAAVSPRRVVRTGRALSLGRVLNSLRYQTGPYSKSRKEGNWNKEERKK